MEKTNLNQSRFSYNPQLQNTEMVEKLFSVRQKQFEFLLNDIKKEKENSIPQHHLIIGRRGMGKTTMLKRIEVELHKEEYNKQFIPLLFSEEQYNVRDLAEFWLNSLDALADSLQCYKIESYVKKIDKTVEALLRKKDEAISEEAYKFLMDNCRELKRRPVLLVDNIDIVFNGLEIDDQWTLRKLLSENGAPIVVGGGVTATDDVTTYEMPFYDFFKIQYLKKLTYEEFIKLLNNLEEISQKKIEANPSRKKALHKLTGGNPRITKILFEQISKGFSTDINDDLNVLVDELTPLYKAKFEELPQQQRVILDAIALNWDAISLKNLAIETRMENNQLSPQLKRLIDSGWIESTPAYKDKGNAYSISERFFNIYYLIRNSSRRHKKNIYCLSKFLEYFYGKDDLERISDNLLNEDICDSERMFLHLAMSKASVLDMKKREKIEEKAYKALLKDDKLHNEFSYFEKEFLSKKGYSLTERQDIAYYDKLIKLNPNNENAWEWKGNCLRNMKLYDEAIACYDKAIELNPKNENSWFWKGSCLQNMKLYDEAIACYDKAIELNPKDEYAWNNKGYILIELKNNKEAVICFKKAIELNPDYLIAKFHLLFLYRDKLNEPEEATELFNEIEKEIYKDKNKISLHRYYTHKMLFELHNHNLGLAKEHLLKAFEIIEEESELTSIANDIWWAKFGSVIIDLDCGSWLLEIFEEKGYDVVLSPYYTAVKALVIEKQDIKNGKKDAETYLNNRAIEISEPAIDIIKKIRKYSSH